MCEADDFAEAFDFFGGNTAAEVGDAVIAAALVIEMRMGPFAALFDRALCEEFLDRAVKRTCSRIESCVSAAANFPKNGIAVSLTVG